MKEEYRIQLSEEAHVVPYSLQTPRRVPIPLLPKVKAQLERMKALGVISKLDEPTDWYAGVVVVPKADGRVRIYVDLTQLNKCMKREQHILPSVEHVLAQMANAKIFSKLDANSGFWLIQLAKESAKLTTFTTPFGRYHFNRLPFGITSAPEYFQRKIGEVLRDCDGVVCLMDDILIYGRSQEEHHARLVAVLERLRKEGVTLNKNKCQFYVNRIKFLGQVLNEKGISPDPDKVQAIRNITSPTNISELRRFLRMINQLSKFYPNLANSLKPLRDLLSTKNHWFWGTSQQKCFEDQKKKLN